MLEATQETSKLEKRIRDKFGQGVHTANETNAGPFTKEQMEHLRMLVKSSSTSSNFPNASMAHTCIGSKALFNSFLSNVDYGDSDHMTNSFKLFQSYTPCSGNKKIKVVDEGFLFYCWKRFNIDLKKKKSTLTMSFMFQNWLIIFYQLVN